VLKAIKVVMGRIPIFGSMFRTFYQANRPKLKFVRSDQYWEDRYKFGGNSGAGSYNRLAQFKADYLNRFVKAHEIKSIVEFGCGDGAQLALADYPSYCGYDVSKTAVDFCNTKFASDKSKKFRLVSDLNTDQFDLSLSLDVIYHLVEDGVFENYMKSLFLSSKKFVIIYSSNDDIAQTVQHVRHRKFTNWVSKNREEWSLIEKTPNPFPADPNDPKNTSFADLFVFELRH
jgi:SAM-dependent methyltransferase